MTRYAHQCPINVNCRRKDYVLVTLVCEDLVESIEVRYTNFMENRGLQYAAPDASSSVVVRLWSWAFLRCKGAAETKGDAARRQERRVVEKYMFAGRMVEKERRRRGRMSKFERVGEHSCQGETEKFTKVRKKRGRGEVGGPAAAEDTFMGLP